MSTVADYSVLTKAFLASSDVDFSRLYTTSAVEGYLKAFAVIPLALNNPLSSREALNFDWSKLGNDTMWDRVSCRDESGQFIGNIVRVQPSEKEGSIRLVAKVAIPAADASAVEDISVNTFVLLRTDPSTNQDLPIAVATISEGYTLHKHLASGNDPLDAVENATYVSFTIHKLNGYMSVDFNPDAYATYDVTDALSRRIDAIEGMEGIEGLHIAFNSNTGDIILSDADGNVIDQANLHLDADTIIADGEEGYKYVKTDLNQDIHSAKAFMDPTPTKPTEEGGGYGYLSAFGSSSAVNYDTLHASLLRYEDSSNNSVCNGIRVRWTDEYDTPHEEIFCVRSMEGDGYGGTTSGKNFLAWYSYYFDSCGDLSSNYDMWFKSASNAPVEVTNPSSKIYSGNPNFDGIEPVYSHDVFVHTVGNSSLEDWDEFFKLIGFHDGDDIPLGTLLPALMQTVYDADGKLDPEAWIHGADAHNAENVAAQRELAKAEMVAYNSRRPALTEDRQSGTIIDYTGLDVRDGRITLGCGRVGEAGDEIFQKVNYGIQMTERSTDPNIQNRSESLDFTISHFTGNEVSFDANGHATDLTRSTLLSIESGSYISGAPTCLILARVTYNSEDDSPMFTPVRMTAGFSVEPYYRSVDGLRLTIHDYRDNIIGLLNPDGNTLSAPAIIEVQALYTHLNAEYETVPAQQMHTYIGEWLYSSACDGALDHPECVFFCNKIEEWMTAVGLTDPDTEGVELYVVLRVY